MDQAFKPLPLVIGVTGHRDLRDQDIPRLKKAVADVFDRLKADFVDPGGTGGGKTSKDSGETPIIVLSSLAEGADHLVAQVAIEKIFQLIAPLPLPIDEYRCDFEIAPVKPNALKDFNNLVAGLDNPRPFFVGYAEGNSLDQVQTNQDKRNLQYRHLGLFIARHCDVLIALWDGDADHPSIGGTAEIVKFKRSGIPLEVSRSGRASLDAPEIGPVIYVFTPRATKSIPAKYVDVLPGFVSCWGTKLMAEYQELDTALKRPPTTTSAQKELKDRIDQLEPDYRLWKSFEAPIKQSREFNREAARLLASRKGSADTGKSLFWLFNVEKDKPEAELRKMALAIASRYCGLYAVADVLAQKWQKVFKRDWLWLFLLGLLAFACFEAFSHLEPVTKDFHERYRFGVARGLYRGFRCDLCPVFRRASAATSGAIS